MPPTATAEQPALIDHPPLPSYPVSEADFVKWCVDSTYAEWVNGEIILMSPVSPRHSEICSFLNTIATHVARSRRLGRVFGEPVHVRLPTGTRRSPDVFFISAARLDLVRPTEVDGAPDLIIEVISPESVTRDRREKFIDYQASGVAEYWIADPLTSRLEAYRPDGQRYARIADSGGFLASAVLPGFRLRPEWLWQDPLPLPADLLKELGT
jgi:Uma2 family endonuclease